MVLEGVLEEVVVARRRDVVARLVRIGVDRSRAYALLREAEAIGRLRSPTRSVLVDGAAWEAAGPSARGELLVVCAALDNPGTIVAGPWALWLQCSPAERGGPPVAPVLLIQTYRGNASASSRRRRRSVGALQVHVRIGTRFADPIASAFVETEWGSVRCLRPDHAALSTMAYLGSCGAWHGASAAVVAAEREIDVVALARVARALDADVLAKRVLAALEDARGWSVGCSPEHRAARGVLAWSTSPIVPSQSRRGWCDPVLRVIRNE